MPPCTPNAAEVSVASLASVMHEPVSVRSRSSSSSSSSSSSAAAAATATTDSFPEPAPPNAPNPSKGAEVGREPSSSSFTTSSSMSDRPYPWNLVSDRTHYAVGTVVLVAIFFPALLLIVLSTAGGHLMTSLLYERNPPMRRILIKARMAQRLFFRRVADVIMMDPRDSSYLPWMTWSLVSLPPMFYWAYHRYRTHGFELSTFLVYHFVRLGPRYRFFAHHETLIHKEGHAVRCGLFRNVLRRTEGWREPMPKLVRRLLFDHINAGIIGPFYGSMPYHYATAHNKIHHRWHNDTGDVHTNMDVDRTVPGSFVLWIPRFVAYWTGITPLVLFWKRSELRLFRDLAYGMAYYYSLSFLVWYKTDTLFYWAYWLYPLLEAASFLGGIAYIWHAFSDESDPSNQYVNSVTILRGHDNIWNEDYHVVHHHEPKVHWTNMPRSFEENKDKYVDCRATIFADCEQGVFFTWVFGRKWDDMVDHFVDLQYVFSNGERNSDRLMNVREVAEYERTLRKGRQEEVERDMASFHAEVKALLLKRLQYHYMGGRKEEWRGYNESMNKGLRDFEKLPEKQS